MCCKPIDTIYIHLSAVQRIRCKTMCVFVCLCGKDMAGRVCWAPIAPTRRCCTVNERKRKKRLYFLCRFTIMPIVISLSFSELFFLLVECSMFYRHLGYREQRTRTQGAESDQGVKKEKNQRKRNKTGKKKKNQNCDEEEEETGVLRRLLLHWIFHLPIFYFIFFHLLQDAAGGYRPPPQFLGPFSSPQFFSFILFWSFFLCRIIIGGKCERAFKHARPFFFYSLVDDPIASSQGDKKKVFLLFFFLLLAGKNFQT